VPIWEGRTKSSASPPGLAFCSASVRPNGVISISGDGANNEVEIHYDADSGNLVIEGKNGTLVRGETQRHGDPASASGGHGILEWARLVPAL
jgi:hypothetical protein